MFVLMHVWIYRNVTILLIMWWFLSTCYSQDGGLFQRSNRSDVDLLSKQNTSIYKNNSKNHTVTDITSFFNFMFNFRCTISTKTTAKRTTWVSQYHISLWRAFLESFWALWNFGRHDYKFRETWLWFRVTWLQARWLSGDLTVIRCGISGDFVARLTLRGQKSLPHSLRNALNSIPRWFQWFFRSFVTYLAIFLDCSSSPCSSLLISKPPLCKTILFSFVLESCTKTDKLFLLVWRHSLPKSREKQWLLYL